MINAISIWADPRLTYAVATIGIVLLFITIWLFRRRKRTGRQAGIICLMLSILAHVALLLLVPFMIEKNGGSPTVDENASEQEVGVDAVTFSTFNEQMNVADASGTSEEAIVAPLPVEPIAEILDAPPTESTPKSSPEPDFQSQPIPESLASDSSDLTEQINENLDESLGEIFAALADSSQAPTAETTAQKTAPPEPEPQLAQAELTPPAMGQVGDIDPTVPVHPVSTNDAPMAVVPGSMQDDFANRVGAAKDLALNRTGGSADTEAAVKNALKFLVAFQRKDGAWDPMSTGAGQERTPLGENRGGAGRRSETGITGLALLALLGAGHTHQHGEHNENVYRGLAYLISQQKRSGSLAGGSSVYASTYCHGIAALAMCEAAAITKDASAITASKRAILYTGSLQHPTTGGWRYTAGDPGDLSQLGWQAMVLDAGHRAGVHIDQRSVLGMQRFIRSVRSGTTGGLATYRPGEAASRTMTAEALATRMLVGDDVPQREVAEAERYLLQQKPGSGQDNYYYWYYATLALHQLQDDAWVEWNESLKQRLLSTQLADGSWPTGSVWGGYGGKVYTTAMATLCLETYYRHALRSDRDRIADVGNPLR